MRLALISDIHGNLAALEAVLARLDVLGVTDILCLGDVAGYYSDLDACVDLMRERSIPSLMGNHDFYIAQNEPCPRSDSANRCLSYQRANLRPDTLKWLQAQPLRRSCEPVECVHAGWSDPLDEVLSPADTYFDAIPGVFFASGHTHVQYIWRGTRKTYCNPGSVGQPRDGNPRAAFAIWEDSEFQLHRVAYEIERTQRLMESAGFSDYFYRNLSVGSRIGGLIDRPPAIAGISTNHVIG